MNCPVAFFIIVLCSLFFSIADVIAMNETTDTSLNLSKAITESNVTNTTDTFSLNTTIKTNQTEEPFPQQKNTSVRKNESSLNLSIEKRLRDDTLYYSFRYNLSDNEGQTCAISYWVYDNENRTVRSLYTTHSTAEKQVTLSTVEPRACNLENETVSLVVLYINATINCSSNVSNLSTTERYMTEQTIQPVYLIRKENGTLSEAHPESLTCLPFVSTKQEQQNNVSLPVQNTTSNQTKETNGEDQTEQNNSVSIEPQKKDTTQKNKTDQEKDDDEIQYSRPTELVMEQIDITEEGLSIELDLYRNTTRKYTLYIEVKNGSYTIAEPIKEKVREKNTDYSLRYDIPYTKNRMFCSQLRNAEEPTVNAQIQFSGLGLNRVEPIAIPRSSMDKICDIERIELVEENESLSDTNISKVDVKSPLPQTHRTPSVPLTREPSKKPSNTTQEIESPLSSDDDEEIIYRSAEKRYKKYTGYLVGISFAVLLITLFLS